MIDAQVHALADADLTDEHCGMRRGRTVYRGPKDFSLTTVARAETGKTRRLRNRFRFINSGPPALIGCLGSLSQSLNIKGRALVFVDRRGF
jgi:hypothetical protein